jgi:hypothetical protein
MVGELHKSVSFDVGAAPRRSASSFGRMNTHPPEVDEFAERARAFVVWCEGTHDSKSARVFQLESLRQLSSLYTCALSLPGVDYRPAPDPPYLSNEKRNTLTQNLRPLPFQYYWEVFTPSDMDGDHKPVCGDLFDDFLDIYGDLSTGLWLFDHGHVETAVFSWSQMFGAHWGRHLVSAMHALHSYEPKE